MDRSREARRAATMATSNGLPRRRHRTSSLRDSPDDDGPLELQEPARLRDRTGKKDRDRERDRDRDRLERDRSSRAKRRRGEKYLHGSGHRDDAGEGSSEDESINDDEDEDLDDSPVRYASQQSNPVSMSSSSSPYSTLHRRSYPPPAKVLRTAPTWKPADDVMGVSVPRKARSASTKRSHDCWTSGVPVEAIHRQASASPVRPSMPSGSSVIGSPSPAPMSPSSSSISMKKKIKSNGTKPKPPKSASKSPSVIQDDIEIEVAEVLYGLMRQSQDPPKQDPMSNESAKFESRESNRSVAESKSRLSSPVSNSGSVPVQSSQAAQSLCSSQPHLSVVAPKRKRPRSVSHPEENHTSFAPRNSTISSGSKAESDPVAKYEVRSPGTGKTTDTAAPNDGGTINLVNPPSSEAPPEQVKLEKDEKTTALETSHGPDVVMAKVEEAASPVMESVDGRVDSATSEAIPATGGMENRKVEKFEIDLMAPPPQSRLSPETVDVENPDRRQHELLTIDSLAEPPKSKPDEDAVGKGNDDSNATERKPHSTFLEGESHNRNSTARILDLQINADKSDAVGSSCGMNETKLNQLQHKSALGKTPRDDVIVDRTGLSGSVPLPAAWPTGLPPMGYVAPLQGVVSMDGAPMAPAAIQPPGFIFTQPRPRRCGYHCYIAKNILNHQQYAKNYPFWPTPATGNPLYGSKPYNLNIVPPSDLHGNTGGRVGVSCSVQDKGQSLSFFPGQPASKDKSGPSTNVTDGAQKKQFFLPQSLPPGAPSNIMQGPAFIFPMGQQQAAAAANASARTNPASKTSNTAGSTATSASASNPALNVSATVGQAPPAMSFNFPNIPTNETQYLAILGNSPYPFPIPAHVGTAPPYRGGHPQAMPFFNGSFYPSQIIHPSQLQQQQQQPPQSIQIQQQAHQNPSISSASSSSQKQMQNHQQRPLGSSGGNNVGSTNPSVHPSFPAPKSRALHAQQQHEMGGEDSPSTADSRVSRPLHNMGVYGPNFNLPFNPPNFALLTPQAQASLSGPANGSSNGNFGEKKQQQQQHQQPTQIQHTGPKSGMEPMAPQAFAMSFASLNGATTSGLDFSSMAQNHAILQSLPEAARHNYQIMTAAAAAQHAAQQKNASSYRGGAEDGKSNDANNVDDQRKSLGTNRVTSTSLGQSITFSRPELVESSVTNNVLDSSARSLNHVPGSTRSSRSSTSNAAPTMSEQQQQQFLQLQKQQQFAAAAAASRSKNPPTSNGGVYSDHHQHLSSAPSAAAAKFPNALTGLYQGGSPVHSPQWKGTGRATPSQVGSPSMAGATTAPSSSTMKTISQQQQSRNAQQGQQTQISFSGGNLKPSSAPPSQGQQGPTGSQTESLPLRVGSPTTSSVSKGAGGSPRTNTSSSTGNKQGPQPSVLSPQQGNKNSSHSLSSQKPSSLSGRNAPSLLGNPHTSSSSVGNKSQLQHSQQQIQQPQLSKQSIQQAQLFFSSPYMQQAAQQQHTSTSSGQQPSGGFYLQRHRPDQQHAQQHSKSQVGLTPTSSSSSSGMMTLCPVSLGNSTGTTSDPAKAMAAAAAAASNIKGQGILHAAQFAASQAAGGMGFPYVHAVSAAATAVQGKQAEQKQPAGEYHNR